MELIEQLLSCHHSLIRSFLAHIHGHRGNLLQWKSFSLDILHQCSNPEMESRQIYVLNPLPIGLQNIVNFERVQHRTTILYTSLVIYRYYTYPTKDVHIIVKVSIVNSL